MRHLLAIALFTAFIIPASAATTGSNAMTTCAASWKAMAPADQAKTTYKAYSTSCMKAAAAKPAAAPAMAAPAKPMAMQAKPAPAMAMPAAAKTTPGAAPGDRMKACAAKWNAMKADGSAKKTTYKAFSSECLKKS